MVLQGVLEVLPGGIKLLLADVHIEMGLLHVNTFVVVRASSSHDDKLGLSLSLFCHIGVLEELFDSIIAEHVHVELVHNGFNGRFSSKSLVKADGLGHLFKSIIKLYSVSDINIQFLSFSVANTK